MLLTIRFIWLLVIVQNYFVLTVISTIVVVNVLSGEELLCHYYYKEQFS